MMTQIIQPFYLSIFCLSICLPRLELPKSSFMTEHLCLSALCNVTDKDHKGRIDLPRFLAQQGFQTGVIQGLLGSQVSEWIIPLELSFSWDLFLSGSHLVIWTDSLLTSVNRLFTLMAQLSLCLLFYLCLCRCNTFPLLKHHLWWISQGSLHSNFHLHSDDWILGLFGAYV